MELSSFNNEGGPGYHHHVTFQEEQPTAPPHDSSSHHDLPNTMRTTNDEDGKSSGSTATEATKVLQQPQQLPSSSSCCDISNVDEYKSQADSNRRHRHHHHLTPQQRAELIQAYHYGPPFPPVPPFSFNQEEEAGDHTLCFSPCSSPRLSSSFRRTTTPSPRRTTIAVIGSCLLLMALCLSLDVASLLLPWFSRSPKGHDIHYYLKHDNDLSVSDPFNEIPLQRGLHHAQKRASTFLFTSMALTLLLAAIFTGRLCGLRGLSRPFPQILAWLVLAFRGLTLLAWRSGLPYLMNGSFCGVNPKTGEMACHSQLGYLSCYIAFIVWGLITIICLYVKDSHILLLCRRSQQLPTTTAATTTTGMATTMGGLSFEEDEDKEEEERTGGEEDYCCSNCAACMTITCMMVTLLVVIPMVTVGADHQLLTT